MNKWKRSRLEKRDIIFYSDSCMWTVTLQTNRTTWDGNRVRTKAAHDSTSATVTMLWRRHASHRASLCLRSGLCLCRGWDVRRMWGRNVWGFHLSIGLIITCNDACELWCTRISLNLTDSQLNLPFAASKNAAFGDCLKTSISPKWFYSVWSRKITHSAMMYTNLATVLCFSYKMIKPIFLCMAGSLRCLEGNFNSL